jgi:hypothetical protein
MTGQHPQRHDGHRLMAAPRGLHPRNGRAAEHASRAAAALVARIANLA